MPDKASSERSEREDNVRRLVVRYARGNVSLLMGRYTTEKDADEIVACALSRNFSKYAKRKRK